MKKILVFVLSMNLFFISAAYAGLLDKAKTIREKVRSSGGEPDINTTIAGLKEALSVGTGKCRQDRLPDVRVL